MTHDDLQDLVALFAIDALPPEEEMEVRSHLDLCDACSGLAELHRDTAFSLAGLAPAVSPSPALRERLMSEVRATGQSVLAEPPARRRWWPSPAVAVAGMAAAVLLGSTGWMLNHIDNQNEMLAQARRAFAVVSSPSVEAIALSGKQSSRGANGQVFVAEDSASAAVILTGMQDPGQDVYTLWLISGETPASLGDFRPDEAGVAVIHVAQPVAKNQTMAVTLEPKEGNTVPRGPILLST